MGRFLVATVLAALVSLSFPGISATQAGSAADDDPRELSLQAIDRWIATHRSLKSLPRERLEDWSPVVIDVHVPPGSDPGHATSVGAELGPWVAKLEEIFAREYATPLELSRHEAHPLLYLLVLASRGDYVNYLDAGVPSAWRGHTITFDPRQGIVVTYRDARNPIRGYRNDILWFCARSLVEAHRLVQDGEWNVLWLQQGFLRYLTFDASLLPDDLEKHPLDQRAVAYAARYGAEPILRTGYLHPLRELVAFSNADALARELPGRAVGARLEHDYSLGSYCFEAQAYLFVHFLHHGANGEWRDEFDRLLERALAGVAGAEAARQVFGATGLDELEPAYWAYVNELASRVGTDIVVRVPDPLPDPKPEPESSAAAGPARASSNSSASPTPSAQPPVAPPEPVETWALSDLELTAGETEAWIARAVHRALAGDLDRAASDLGEAAGAAGELGDRVSIEAQRVLALHALRRAVLEELFAAKKPLKLDVGGQKLSAKIAVVDGALVRLESNKLGIESVALAELPAQTVIDHASKELLARSGGWLAAWPACVAGDTKWKRVLVNDKSEVALALRADAETYYPAIRVRAQAALRLAEIRALAESSEVARATPLVEAIRAIWSEHSGEAFVSSRARPLRGAARGAIALLAEGYDPVDHLHAKTIDHLPEGRVRVKYAFDDPAELEDLPAWPGYGDREFTELPIALPPEETSVGIAGRALVANGQRTLRHVLDFEGPVTVRWTSSFSYLAGKPMQRVMFRVGMHADAEENSISANIVGWMYLDGKDVFVQVPGPDGFDFENDRVYSMELVHDGARVECTKDGVLQGSASAAEWQRGSVVLVLNSDMPLTFDDFEIEGKPAPATIETARRAWAKSQLESLGIPLER